MGVADVRHSQDSSVSQSWTGGLEFAEAAGTVRNRRCWRGCKLDGPGIWDGGTSHARSQDLVRERLAMRPGQRGSLLHGTIDL